MPDSTTASSTGTFWMWFCSLPITGWMADENTMRRTPAALAAPALRLHLLTLPNRRPTPKLRSFMDHVAAEFSRTPPAGGSRVRTSR